MIRTAVVLGWLCLALSACGTLHPTAPVPPTRPAALARGDEILAALRPSLNGYPPAVASHAQLDALTTRWREGEAEMLAIEARDPNDAEVEWRLGELYRFGHNLDQPHAPERCVTHNRRALALDPDSIDALLSLASFYTDVGMQYAPQGEPLVRRALALAPPPAVQRRAWRILTINLYYQGRFAEARDAADEWSRVAPDDPAAPKVRDIAAHAAAKGASQFQRVGTVGPGATGAPTLQPGDVVFTPPAP
jgi:hypothetical protein